MPLPSPGHLPDPEIEPGSPALQGDSLPSKPPGTDRDPGQILSQWLPSQTLKTMWINGLLRERAHRASGGCRPRVRGGHPSALCGQLCWGGAGKQALALGGETGRALWSATADGVVMPLACGVFVLLCVCVCAHFLDLATKEMETLCPVLEGDGWALSNAQFKLHPGCGV